MSLAHDFCVCLKRRLALPAVPLACLCLLGTAAIILERSELGQQIERT